VTASLDSRGAVRLRSRDVFVNCPFDHSWQLVFDAIIFTLRPLGFVPRCALDLDSEPFRYRAFISDIAGQDMHHHSQRVRGLRCRLSFHTVESHLRARSGFAPPH
jgi:hypothetical protein